MPFAKHLLAVHCKPLLSGSVIILGDTDLNCHEMTLNGKCIIFPLNTACSLPSCRFSLWRHRTSPRLSTFLGKTEPSFGVSSGFLARKEKKHHFADFLQIPRSTQLSFPFEVQAAEQHFRALEQRRQATLRLVKVYVYGAKPAPSGGHFCSQKQKV